MIIFDTSFLISFYNTRDENHSKAVEIMRKLNTQANFAITDYIFDEFATVALVRIKDLKRVIKMCEEIRASAKMFKIEDDIFEETWRFFKKQKGTLSFTDCSSVCVLKRFGIDSIATFDKEFKKLNGIDVLS